MNNLKTLRKKKGLTQTEIAKMLGISQNSYSYWESDKVKIDNQSLQKLADYYGVSTDYLLGRDEIPAFIASDKYKDLHVAFTKGLENLDEQDLQIVLGLINRLNEEKK